MRPVLVFASLIAVVALLAAAPARATSGEVETGGSWQGAYAGLQIGGAVGESRRDFTPRPSTNTTGDFGTSGVTGGLTGGYNLQVDNLVAGIEADFSGSSLTGDHTCPGTAFDCRTYSNWLGTARPRIGYAFGALLPYATGGLAVGDIHAHSRNFVTAATGSEFDNTETGWTAGAGLEYALPAAMHLSVKAEYLYVDLNDSHGPSSTGLPTSVRFDENIGRVGLNYHF